MVGQAAMMECISTELIEKCPEYRRRFAEAKPFRHVSIDNFFNESFCSTLCQQFPRFDEKSALNENGQVGGKSTRERVRELGSGFALLDDVVKSQEFLSLVGSITGVADLQYDPHYFGGGTHENREGQDLDAHVDFNYHPLSRQHRRLNLIVYLNPQWEDAWGGSLQLHRDPYLDPRDDDIITITPLLNRCVIFETNEYSWHGFRRIELPEDKKDWSRKSFALYFYTDSRPQNETVDEHSTVYVERHLPDRFTSGFTLQEQDVQELRVLLGRRDQHLKRLYKNIHRLYGEVNRLKDQLPSGGIYLPPEGSSSGKAVVSEMDSSDRMIRALRARIHEFETSTSWRLTAPVRAIKRLFTGSS